MALKDMSRDCAEGMKPYSDEIIVACHNALKSGNLKHGECVRLMYPIGKMLSLLPPPTILPKLEPILTPYLQEMQVKKQQHGTKYNSEGFGPSTQSPGFGKFYGLSNGLKSS